MNKYNSKETSEFAKRAMVMIERSNDKGFFEILDKLTKSKEILVDIFFLSLPRCFIDARVALFFVEKPPSTILSLPELETGVLFVALLS